MSDEKLEILREIRDRQKEALALQREQFEFLKKQYDRAEAIQDKAERLQDKGMTVINRVIVPLVVFLVLILLLSMFV